MTYPQRCVDECTDGLLSDRQRWAEEEENELLTGFVNNKNQGKFLRQIVFDNKEQFPLIFAEHCSTLMLHT